MDGKTCKVVLSLGSNYGDRERSVGKARDWLLSVLEETESSGIYETPPVGNSGSTNYINCVIAGIFPDDYHILEKLCKDYERNNGRDEESRRLKQVPIDIDIVMSDGEILRPKDFAASFFQIGYKGLSDTI